MQSILNVGRLWVDRSDERDYAALLGNRILGGDFLSRLNQNLREKHGYSYGARSGFRFRRKGSFFTVSTAVRTDATAPALKEVLSELDGLAGTKPLSDAEIALAVGAEVKEYPDEFASPQSIAGALGEMAEYQLPPDYLDTFLDRLQSTKAAEIGKTMAEVVAKN